MHPLALVLMALDVYSFFVSIYPMLRKNPAIYAFIFASFFLYRLKSQPEVISHINSDKNVESLETSTQNLPSINIDYLKSLQKLEYVNPQKIGMWGHSMAGNLSLRASLVEPDIKAVVIWAGAVYSYQDFAKFRLNDNSYVRRPSDPHYANEDLTEEFQSKVSELRDNSAQVNFNDEFWTGVSLTKNLKYLNIPIQIHHSVNDPVVNVGYSRDLAEVLKNENKQYELFEYQGGGHSIDSPYFEQAMQKTVEFFNENL